MMKRKNIQSLFLTVTFCLTAGVLVLTGCTGDGITDPSDSDTPTSGAAAVSITLGKIGTLAKRSVIEMEHLIIQISVEETDSIVITDTIALSGYEDTTVGDIFPDLTAPEDFVLTVTSIDDNGETIHSGTDNFTTEPGDTVQVSLDLDAQYSMLRASFNDIPDSVDEVVLEIDDVDTLDSSFTTGSKEKIILEYDYLEADAEGIEYDISLKANGSFYGNDTVLYAADTTIMAISSIDTSYQVVLTWVGPGIPDGAAEITVTIGNVGTTQINAEFEQVEE